MVKLPAFSTPSTVYHYKGSLTTPNCDEGVQWFVNSQPILISAKSLASLRSLINGGHGDGISRKTQPLNGRRIIKVGTGCKLFCKWPHSKIILITIFFREFLLPFTRIIITFAIIFAFKSLLYHLSFAHITTSCKSMFLFLSTIFELFLSIKYHER